MINKFAMGTRIREARVNCGMSVRYVTKKLGLTRETTVYEWESGKFIPSIEHLYFLSKLYNTTMEEFLAFEGGESAFYGMYLLKTENLFTAAA